MKIVNEEERKILYKNRRMCLENVFRRNEGLTMLQWGIVSVLGCLAYVFITFFIICYSIDELDLFKILGSDFVSKLIILLVAIVLGILYIIFREINYRIMYKRFFIHGHLEVNTAIVKGVHNKCVTYLENGSKDVNGQPYLIDYHIDKRRFRKCKVKEDDIILVLHGEDRWHNTLTRIAVVNEKLRQFVSEVEEVNDCEKLNHYPDDIILKLSREEWIPTKEEAAKLVDESYEEQKKIQLSYVKKMVKYFVFAFALLGYAHGMSVNENGPFPIVYVTIYGLGGLGICALARSMGVANIERRLLNNVSSVQEVLFMNEVYDTTAILKKNLRCFELCGWDNEQKAYIKKKYTVYNMFIKRKNMGTVYYLLKGIGNSYMIVEKK